MSSLVRKSPLALHMNLSSDCGVRDGCMTASIYSNLEEEYRCVRTSVGVSDLCHYSKIKVSGDAAIELVNYVSLADLELLPINQMQTSFLLNTNGSPRSEAFIVNNGDHFLILSEGEDFTQLFADLKILAEEKFPSAQVLDLTQSLALLGLDGPFSWELLKTIMGTRVIGTRYLEVVHGNAFEGVDFVLARAGKSGEYGYLMWTEVENAETLWDHMIALGERFDIKPLGYQVLDLCKLENRFPSMHNEGARISNILELNTRVLFSQEKDDHLGREAIGQYIESTDKKRVIGITVPNGSESPDIGASVSCGGKNIGTVVSAGFSYTLDCWIALTLVEDEYAVVGLDYDIQNGDGTLHACTTSAPFIFNKSMQLRPQEDSYFN